MAGRGDEVRVHVDEPTGPEEGARALHLLGTGLVRHADGLVLLCIGTDRSIGDALGPLTGTLLYEQGPWPFRLMGTLEHPVHAGNLGETIALIERDYRSPVIVAVDACLGRTESVGYIGIGKGSLRPGAGVNKMLPAVGHLYVTGVVNVGGFMEYFVLQNTRLSLVMRMAKFLAQSLGRGLTHLAESRRAEAMT